MNQMKKSALRVIVCAVLLMLSPQVYAAPALINYQGVLTNMSGLPVTDTLSFTFRIFEFADKGVAGDELWREKQSVDVKNGVYSVMLGSESGQLTPDLFADDSRWLEVSVNDEILTPRQPITSVAYAHNADTLDGVDSAALQKIITGTCATGSSIRVINSNGAVTCEIDDVSATAWSQSASNLNYNVGNVGIGTTTPAARLDVTGQTSDGTMAGLNVKNSSGTSLLYVRNDGKVGIGTTWPVAQLSVGGDTVIIGKLGVGSLSPQADLHVHNNTYPRLKLTNSTTGQGNLDGSGIGIPNTGSKKNLDIVNYEQADIRLYTGGTLKLKIQNDGNVGVGVVTPTVKLDVANTVRVSNYTVPATGAGLEMGYSPYSAGGLGVITAYDRVTNEPKPVYFGSSKVGIGPGSAASVPQHTLSVDGDASVTGEFKYNTPRNYKKQFPPSAFIAPDIELRINDQTWMDTLVEVSFDVNDALMPDFIKDPVNYESDSYVSTYVPSARLSITNYWTYRTYTKAGGATGALPIQVYAPVDLPHGAEIISITGHYYSYSGTKQRSLALLKRSTATIGEKIIAIAASTSDPGRGLHAVQSTNIKPADTIIDNNQYTYSLFWQSKYERFFGATIEYQVDHVGY